MNHITCGLTAKNQDQLRNPTLGNRVWTVFQRDNSWDRHHRHQQRRSGGSQAVSLMSSMDIYSHQLTRLLDDSSSSTIHVVTRNVCKLSSQPRYDTIRCDTRCHLTCADKSQLNLPHGTNNEKVENRKK